MIKNYFLSISLPIKLGWWPRKQLVSLTKPLMAKSNKFRLSNSNVEAFNPQQ